MRRIWIMMLVLSLSACQTTPPKDWYHLSEKNKKVALDDYNQLIMRHMYDAYAFVPFHNIKVKLLGGRLIHDGKTFAYQPVALALSDQQCRDVSIQAVGQENNDTPLRLQACYKDDALTLRALNYDHPITVYRVTRWQQGIDYHPISLGWPDHLENIHVFVVAYYPNMMFPKS